MGTPRSYSFANDLVQSTNSDIVNTITERGSVCYTRDSPDSDTMASLYSDTTRNVTVNDRPFVATDSIKVSGDEEKERFENFLKSNFKQENIDKLKEHYSQRPISMGLVAFADHMAHENWKPRIPVSKANLYEEKGVVYFTVSVESIPILRRDDDKIKLGTIQGPVDVKFMLTENGFELQKISTDSLILRDLYLGHASEERILRACVIPEVESALKAQRYKLMFESKSQDEFGISTLNDALEFIQNYKENKINFEEIEASFDALIKKVDPKKGFGKRLSTILFSVPATMFHHSAPTTRDILIQSLATLRSTSELIPKVEQAPQIRNG